MSKQAEGIVEFLHQATADGDTADWEGLVRVVVSCRKCELGKLL
jgi:hypothetical protein